MISFPIAQALCGLESPQWPVIRFDSGNRGFKEFLKKLGFSPPQRQSGRLTPQEIQSAGYNPASFQAIAALDSSYREEALPTDPPRSFSKDHFVSDFEAKQANEILRRIDSVSEFKRFTARGSGWDQNLVSFFRDQVLNDRQYFVQYRKLFGGDEDNWFPKISREEDTYQRYVKIKAWRDERNKMGRREGVMAPPVISANHFDPTRPDLMKGIFFRPEQMEPAGIRYQLQRARQALATILLGNYVPKGLNTNFIPGHGGITVQVSPDGYFVSLPGALGMLNPGCMGNTINGKDAAWVEAIPSGTKIQSESGKKIPLSDRSIVLAPEYVYFLREENEGIVSGWLKALEGNNYIPLADTPPRLGEWVYIISFPFVPAPPNREPLVSVGNITRITDKGYFEVDAEIRDGSEGAAVVRVKGAENESSEEDGVELVGLVIGSWQKDFDSYKKIPFSRWGRKPYTGLLAYPLLRQRVISKARLQR